jgi:alkaline phosphatase D
MNRLSRRQFIAVAAAMGATMGWADAKTSPSSLAWRERRDLFTEGVASGDPATESVLLWTRYSAGGTAEAVSLTVEVAEDPAFERVVATARTRALAAADHTCRVLIGGLRPGQIYWYRFATERGEGSRLGRTRTAYPASDPRPVRFTFVSCQNVCEGAQNAYRRMIFEDEHAPAEEQLAFVLHLGDFIYEVVDYPEDRPGGRRYDRRLRDRVRFPDGEKIGKFRIAATLADYRTLYRAYLRTRICRTRVHAGPSCRSGTTTSSRGWAGSRCGASRATNVRRKHARSQQTRHGSSISPRASRSRAASRWSALRRPW